MLVLQHSQNLGLTLWMDVWSTLTLACTLLALNPKKTECLTSQAIIVIFLVDAISSTFNVRCLVYGIKQASVHTPPHVGKAKESGNKCQKLATSHKTRQLLEFGSFENPTSLIESWSGTAPWARGAGRKAAPNMEARTIASPLIVKGFGSKHVTMARAFTLYLNGAGVPSSWPASRKQKNDMQMFNEFIWTVHCPSVCPLNHGPPW